MPRSYLKVYFDFDEKTDELSDIEKARLLLALYRYAKTGEKPALAGNERFLFSIFKGDIDRDIASYNTKVANGSLGGRPAKAKPDETENNLTKPEETETPKNKNKNKNKDILKENDLTVIKEKRKRFSPPTADEVTAYCQERGNHVDPQRFVDFYTAKGWRVGNNPMQDWKAAVRTWEQRDNITPLNTGQTYTQRQYTESDLEARITEL